MDVVADADAHVAERKRHLRRQPPVGGGDVVRRGQLDVAGIAGNGDDRRAGPFGDRGVVGELWRRRRAALRCAARIASKAKPCGVSAACSPSRGTVAVTRPAASTRFSVLATGSVGTTASAFVEGRNDAIDEGRGGEGPGGVVDQHARGMPAGERREAVADRILPGRATGHRRHQMVMAAAQRTR